MVLCFLKNKLVTVFCVFSLSLMVTSLLYAKERVSYTTNDSLLYDSDKGVEPLKRTKQQYQPEMVLTLFRPEEHPDGKWTKLVFTDAFQRLGMKFVYIEYPAKRGSMMADCGKIDGVLSRPQKFEVLHPNLIKVPESYISVNYSAFTINPAIHVDGWESLRGTGYRIDYIRGIEVVKLSLHEVVKPEQINELAHWRQGLKKLIAHRTDLFLGVELTILPELQTKEFKGAGIRKAGLLFSVPLYVYLHKTHADIVPKLAEVLKSMKSEALIEKYRVIAYGQ